MYALLFTGKKINFTGKLTLDSAMISEVYCVLTDKINVYHTSRHPSSS